MLSCGVRQKVSGAGAVVQQQRFMSGRRIAYPTFPFRKLTRQHPKSHDTNLKYAMRQFLGPKNFKGEYPMNKYFYVPTDHVPNYVKPDLERGQALQNAKKETLRMRHDGSYEVDPKLVNLSEKVYPKRSLQPFPLNKHCQTNYIISTELKQDIYNEITNLGMTAQQVSQKYGLKIPRIEAIIKLQEIEMKWLKHNKVKEDTKVMASTLFKMFPVFNPNNNTEVTRNQEGIQTFSRKENLSEIPVPPKALNSRFLTISESQPFGPVDAANILELEPAITTLEKLSTEGQHSSGRTVKDNKVKTIYGELLEGEKSQFKFKDAKVGRVGFRYGAGNRDSKKDRRIDFDAQGKMIYV
ncbi:hypothetical protein TPHA_0A04640 [Tetrapisispora phaffii CBS 4417]|uniref:37S ribosomal protein S35, mitochondrial n=1 Tax=Tetrapisispora phaffii (strain ATCC 24235 / CBS 4417 / NBRC 1672 / NRRL Y-8282 / UCD 70-5) TaxID=1071381 RepID=G8BNQ9_TETPH|nr:mitochondrial 37S ribosomal protein MRPS35 TPHA_0A04640 [Tetrapisispora phaffii CBS 4417]CCE61537.1 hypothetical protein TPHA_0A04640 [Tetrapisispora phaffii CBS 4417]